MAWGQTVKGAFERGQVNVNWAEGGHQRKGHHFLHLFSKIRRGPFPKSPDCHQSVLHPALTQGHRWLPLAWGPSPSLLCLSLTRMPCYLSRLPTPSLLARLFCALCPAWVPSPSLSSPPLSWQSRDPAKQKQKSVSVTAFCVPSLPLG